MKGMTVKQISNIVGVDERSIQRWTQKAADKMSSVADKMSSAGHGKNAEYTLEEVVAIIRAGGRSTLADLLADNAAKSQEAALWRPNGTQLHQLRMLVKDGVLKAEHVQRMIGFEPVKHAPPTDMRLDVADEQTGLAALSEVRDRFGEKAQRAAYGAAKSVEQRERDKRARERNQRLIDFNSSTQDHMNGRRGSS